MSQAVSQAETSTPSYDELVAINRMQSQELELLRFKLNQLLEGKYGKSSQKSYPDSPAQGNLFEPSLLGNEKEENEEEEYTEVAPHKRKRRSKKSIPEDLPVEVIEYAPEHTHCECGCELGEFSRDTREEVEYRPARFFRRKHVVVYSSCPKCKTVYGGKTPVESRPVIPGAQVGPGFLSHVVVSKFSDSLPYYRQSQIYERDGVFFPDKTLSRYGLTVAALLEPIAKAIKQFLLEKRYLQADETHLDVLDSEKSHTCHCGRLWTLLDPLSSMTYYEYHPGRSQEAADAFLESFNGTLQTDAYVCYDNYPGKHIGCMSHARGYFVKAKKLAAKDSRHVINLIGRLYRIERGLKKTRAKLSDSKWFEKRHEIRQKLSAPILEELRLYLIRIKDRWLLEEHPMTKAINYMLSRYQVFTAYLDDGLYEIDNNPIERAIRPIAIGRRNWLFAGSDHGAKMAAVLLTVIQCCKMQGINPQQYLTDVLPRLADQGTKSLAGLTPLDWKQSKALSSTRHRSA